MFTRTVNGLINFNKFLNVDFVIFVEGGDTTYNIDDALNGKYNEESIDIKFWEEIFSIFSPTAKIEFRALGSCYAVRSLAKLMKNQEDCRIICATDRDYSTYFWDGYDVDGCLITWGYSWENDVCSSDKIWGMLKYFSNKQKTKVSANEDALYIIDKQCRSLRKIMIMDYILLGLGDHLIQRNKTRKYIKGQGLEIYCDSQSALQDYKRIKNRKKFSLANSKSFQIKALNEKKDICGHFLMDLYFFVFFNLMKRSTAIPTVRKDHFVFEAIKNFFDHLKGDKTLDIYNHYKIQFEKHKVLEKWVASAK